MFTIHRDENEVFVFGSITVKAAWMPKPESYSPTQSGITEALRKHGFDRFTGVCHRDDGTIVGWDYPAKLGVFDGCRVKCVDSAAADLAEQVLRQHPSVAV
jgi:hypothetical protein